MKKFKALFMVGVLSLFASCGATTSGTTTGSTSLGPNQTAATIPSSIAATYNLTYNEINAGSGITNGTTTQFVVGTDGKLTIDGSTILSNPFLYRGNAQEAIWLDTANGLAYSLSSLTTGFNEINVSNDKMYDETGFQFYGQYRSTSTAAFVCPNVAGSLDFGGATHADAGAVFCPSSKPTLSAALNNQLNFVDSGGPVDYTAHPSASLAVFETGGIGSGTTGYVFIKYSIGAKVWELTSLSATLASLGVVVDATAKTLTFNSSVAILPSKSGGATGTVPLGGTISYQ